jgi:hypothetical protein
VFEASLYYDNAVWSWHLEYQVPIVRYCHESRKRGSPEDRVILRGPVHDFEVELFSSVVLAITKADIECYSIQWIIGTP